MPLERNPSVLRGGDFHHPLRDQFMPDQRMPMHDHVVVCRKVRYVVRGHKIKFIRVRLW